MLGKIEIFIHQFPTRCIKIITLLHISAPLVKEVIGAHHLNVRRLRLDVEIFTSIEKGGHQVYKGSNECSNESGYKRDGTQGKLSHINVTS